MYEPVNEETRIVNGSDGDKMNTTEKKIIGYFLKHKDATFSQLTSDTLINVHEAHEAMLSLQKAGIIKGRGFASHTECYYVVGGREFFSNENLGEMFNATKSNS